MRIRLSTLAPLALLVPLALLTACGTLAAQSQSRTPSREREQGGDRQARAFLMRADDGDASRPRIGIVAVGTGERDTLGVLVSTVSDGGPAAKAGIEAGDRITAINGVNLKLSAADADDGEMQGITARRLTRVLGRLTVGDEVELRFVRDGQSRSVKVKTVAASELRGETLALTGNMRQRLDRAALGVGLGSSGSRRDTSGIVITSVSNDGPADKSGIEEGDRIAAINGVDLRVPSEDAGDWGASGSRVRRLNREMEKVKAGEEVELRLYRVGQLRTVKVTTVRARDLAADVQNAFMFEGIGASGLPMLHFSVSGRPPPPPPPP
ncbi:MAG: PDZ domain-containing protein, partial [Gemmatimonadaceae bacterium]|nr:PDZ domain-containing protein [Gemmatimonadaceae bacterium]